ncbi:hypothetical protein PybrP1_007148 [[Pythium] brassicae (nom. inval.)]|nr:hypothetical protein PybrP1_007148 [[Pythium] brassicae (nom. inval.)]
MLCKEKQERIEEKKEIVQLWPDGLVLPTVLKPFEVTPSTSAADENARANYAADDNRVADHDDSSENENDNENDSESVEDKPLDPIALRNQVAVELERHKQLELELAKCQAQQRALALQLLNASRECFEREREALAAEDEERKGEERKKRKARLQEQAAAKAKAEAMEKKNRANRAYLATPLSLDPRVRLRHQLDEEYVHTKTMETKVLEIEQLEFDLLEKSSLRHEEATAKSESLADLCAQRTSMAAEAAKEGLSKEETEALLRDEAELRLFKRSVDAEQHWRGYEKEEVMRVEELAQAMTRLKSLESVQRQLTLDLALYESDAPFFATLAEQEKEVNARMWQLQADSQIERVRFMIERAAREEATFQMTDRLEQLNVELEAAQRLPVQALNVLERLALEKESRARCDALESQVRELQGRYAKEMEAKALLIALEARSHAYALQKLEEEVKLFNEKQALWDLNFALEDELQVERKTIERLFLLMEDEKAALLLPGPTDDGGLQPQRLQQAQEEAAAVFDAKLQLVQQARQFLLLCYDRESRWRKLAAVALIKDCSSEEWMTAMQRERHEGMMALLQEQHDAEVLALKKELKLLQKVKAALHAQIDELHATVDRMRLAYQGSSEHVREHAKAVILVLNAEVEGQKQALRDEQKRAQEERERLIGEHDAIRGDLEGRLLELEDIGDKQRHWLTAAKRELNAQRVTNEELVKAYQSLEKRRATETNDMRFRIASQIKKINNIEMWNLSLKLKAKEANAERIQMQRAAEQLVAQHKEQQRLLRQKNWRHRVTAQAVLTDVDLLFRFFADGLEILSGATPEINARLRANGAIEVMAQLAQHCCQPTIAAVCAKALGLLSWNANATPRALGWQAKRRWFSWVVAQSDAVLAKLAQQNTAFDAVADETSVETNWLADPSDSVGAEESDHDAVSRSGKKLQFIKTWRHFDELQFPDANTSNQEHIGLSPSVLKTLIDLCHPRASDVRAWDKVDTVNWKETRLEIQQNALRSLALIVMNARTTAIVGRMDGCIALLVGLMAPTERLREDPQVACNTIRALGNLAFRNQFNQLAITSHGGVPYLLAYCDEATDVDLILAATQALAHLSQEETSVCEAIFRADGVPLLARLCHSPRIYDTVELDVYEQIQAYAAQVIANIVAALDSVDAESAHRSQSVASAILDADAEAGSSDRARAVGGVASFVLMCASCTRNVAYHAALVLGSLAQHDPIRAAIGSAGGVDALFLLADRPEDLAMVVQATWALANLTWNRDNQYRVARYLDRLLSLCSLSECVVTRSSNQEQESRAMRPEQDATADSAEDDTSDAELARQIREHGLCILANALFYNDANRQLVASQRQWMQLLHRNCVRGQGLTLEHSARALCSLSYSDAIALALGGDSNSERWGWGWGLPANGLEVFVRLCGHAANPLVQRHGLFGVINLCLHDANKTRMLDVPHGIETLVNLSGSTDPDVCEPAREALELLADVHELQRGGGVVSSAALATADVKKLVALLSEAASPAVIAMLSDAIADAVWKTPSAKVTLRNEHGLEKLLELCVRPLGGVRERGGVSADMSAAQERQLLVSCLWALRNAVSDNVRNQDVVGALEGVQQLVRLLYDRQQRSEDVVEAVLAALVALATKHPRNSQQLVRVGLDMLLSLADGGDGGGDGGGSHGDDDDERERTFLPPLVPRKAATGATPAPTGRHERQNAALARDLLHLVAPYNTLAGAADGGGGGGGVSGSGSSPDKRSKARRFQQLHHHQEQQQQLS